MRRRIRDKPEPTIALINVVFLMLVFFLVAGSLARPPDPALTLVRTAELDHASPPDALVIAADGALSYRGAALADAAAYLALPEQAGKPVIRIVPDRDLPAAALVRLGAELRAGGADRVVIVTERGLE